MTANPGNSSNVREEMGDGDAGARAPLLAVAFPPKWLVRCSWGNVSFVEGLVLTPVAVEMDAAEVSVIHDDFATELTPNRYV